MLQVSSNICNPGIINQSTNILRDLLSTVDTIVPDTIKWKFNNLIKLELLYVSFNIVIHAPSINQQIFEQFAFNGWVDFTWFNEVEVQTMVNSVTSGYVFSAKRLSSFLRPPVPRTYKHSHIDLGPRGCTFWALFVFNLNGKYIYM